MDLVVLSKSFRGSADDEKRSVAKPAVLMGAGAAGTAGGVLFQRQANIADQRLTDKEWNISRRRHLDNAEKQSRREKAMRRAESRMEDARAAGNQRVYEKRRARAQRKAAGLQRSMALGDKLGRREERTRHLKDAVRSTIKPARVGTGIAAGAAGLGAASLGYTMLRNRRIDAERAKADKPVSKGLLISVNQPY